MAKNYFGRKDVIMRYTLQYKKTVRKIAPTQKNPLAIRHKYTKGKEGGDEKLGRILIFL